MKRDYQTEIGGLKQLKIIALISMRKLHPHPKKILKKGNGLGKKSNSFFMF